MFPTHDMWIHYSLSLNFNKLIVSKINDKTTWVWQNHKSKETLANGSWSFGSWPYKIQSESNIVDNFIKSNILKKYAMVSTQRHAKPRTQQLVCCKESIFLPDCNRFGHYRWNSSLNSGTRSWAGIDTSWLTYRITASLLVCLDWHCRT